MKFRVPNVTNRIILRRIISQHLPYSAVMEDGELKIWYEIPENGSIEKRCLQVLDLRFKKHPGNFVLDFEFDNGVCIFSVLQRPRVLMEIN